MFVVVGYNPICGGFEYVWVSACFFIRFLSPYNAYMSFFWSDQGVQDTVAPLYRAQGFVVLWKQPVPKADILK